MSSKLSADRKSILKTLKTRFDNKTSTKYEKLIWDMCTDLSNEYEESVEDIYKKYAYEKVGCIFTSDKNQLEKTLKDIQNSILDWDSCSYNDFRKRLEEDNSKITEGIKIEKGEYKCRNKNCKSNECYFYQVQTRSADEGATTFVVCTKCSTRYRFN